jgi:hypothetical protein
VKKPRQARLLRQSYRAVKPVSLMCSDGAMLHHQHGTTPAPEVRKRTFPCLVVGTATVAQQWRTVAHPWFTVGLGVKSLMLQGVSESFTLAGQDAWGIGERIA